MRARSLRDGAMLADLGSLALIAVLAAVAGWRALSYRLFQHAEPGAGLFPFLVSAITAICCLAAIVLRLGAGSPSPAAISDEGPVLRRKLSLYIAVVLVWPWLLAPLGYLLSTGLALLVVLRFAEGARWPPSLSVIVAALAASWFLFERLLGVPLPRGWFGVG